MLSVPSLYTGLYQPRDDRDNIEIPNYRKFEREYTADKILGKGGFGLVFQGRLPMPFSGKIVKNQMKLILFL